MATATDAELILKLYELRTEAVLRKARAWVVGWWPAHFDEIAAVQRDMGSENNNYYRQVIGYWEMAAAMVLRGAIDPDLFLDCNGENIFIYAKMTPFFGDYTKASGRGFMPNTAKLIETFPAYGERYAMALAMLEARRKQAAG